QAIISGRAPQAARMAAARGLLPLPQSDLLEALVALRESDDAEVSQAASVTLESQEKDALLAVARESATAPAVLGYLAAHKSSAREIQEAVTLNASTPDDSIALLASHTPDGALLELIAINQQRLIRAPQIIDAIIGNPARTPDAERRALETRREFFEKERGAQQIAGELRARGKTAAAEFLETAESLGADGALSLNDAWLIAEHIEVSDLDIDDSWLSLEHIEIFEETLEQREANAERVITETLREGDAAPERIALIRRIMLMTVKDRIKLGLKGDREARAILIRDPNKVVATAVINNPRITDHEVESIAAMRTVADEVLRLIAMNRAWARSYTIIHNLVRNPRTPIATSIGILPRIRGKDLQHLSQNRNVPEGVRRQAARLNQTRAGH
ncbi:MAG: hypothetical protein LC731_05660, partial [Acidobacteria bacterium]|nr:hypothetical protein [Acidobacteriota bacterium]